MNKAYSIIPLLLLGLLTVLGCNDAGARQRVTPESTDPLVIGQTYFAANCAACHGSTGEGVTGLGKDMTRSELIATQSDAELVELLLVGRAATDPLNETGVAMPPKGGNPTLEEPDLYHIVAYMRTLMKEPEE